MKLYVACNDEQQELIGQDSYYEANGCAHCLNSGYRGRIAIFEVLWVNPQVAQLIADQANEADIIAACPDFVSLLADGLDKVKQGISSFSELEKLGLLEIKSNNTYISKLIEDNIKNAFDIYDNKNYEEKKYTVILNVNDSIESSLLANSIRKIEMSINYKIIEKKSNIVLLSDSFSRNSLLLFTYLSDDFNELSLSLLFSKTFT